MLFLSASIRAYGAEAAFKLQSMKRIDKYTRAARSFYNLNRWICIRTDAIGGVFSAALATYLIYGSTSPDAARTGFSLSMAVAFSGMVRMPLATPSTREVLRGRKQILYFVRFLNMFEVEGEHHSRTMPNAAPSNRL